MRVLILGGFGMLGHKLWQTCAAQFDAYATVRGAVSDYERFEILDRRRLIGEVRAEDSEGVARSLAQVRPDVVVNCIGITKQHPLAKDLISSITVNSLFPHRVAQLACDYGARFIQVSTDCVFSGRQGNYAEDDLADPPDSYGVSKLLGEVRGENCMTIRTSMIGRELRSSRGLLEWFLAVRGESVPGFARAIFSGLTTQALSAVIVSVIVEHPQLTGLWNVAAAPISKFDLLTLVKQTYGLTIEIQRDESFVCDRSLNGERFQAATGIKIPSWTDMIAGLHADETPYDRLRSNN